MTDSKWQRGLVIFSLICAGEAIFTLPYHVTRFFRPTFLEVFDLTATELGVAQSAYGVIAMVAYFFGGPLADRFEPRKLLAGSLWATALGGLYLATFPDVTGVMLVWGFFGLTNILLFWAALIKVTRSWGGDDQQGLAYGLLDGGRGLLAAVLASLGVFAFASAFPLGYDSATLTEKGVILRQVIYGYTIATAAVGVMVWFTLRGIEVETEKQHDSGWATALTQLRAVIKLKVVWLQATVLVCAYSSYKAFDQYALFAVRGHGLDEIDAAQIVTAGAWTRPVAALALGLLGDRFGISRMALVCFVLLIISHSLFAFTGQALGSLSMILLNTLVTGVAIFGLRGLYFGLLEEGQIPLAVTGTAVGLVSVIGYTPDVYVAAIAGYLIDQNPGLLGFQHLFVLLLAFSVVGALAAWAFTRQAAPSSVTSAR
ncbi:MFS transporter [Luminiphilus sp.]|jgi:sugar phosphate permease|nr:MFS transporter [Luminiphilus sp.]